MARAVPVSPLGRRASSDKTPRLKASSVEFSPSVFVIWWLAIFIVHLTAFGYHARITRFYWLLNNSPLGEMLELYDLSLPQGYCRSVALVNVTISGLHGLAILRLVRNSVHARQLVLYIDDTRDTNSVRLALNQRSRARKFVDTIVGLFAYKGAFGVEGEHFDSVRYVSEFVGTILQTYQAYSINSVVTRRSLSRLYVVVLVFNCWSIPLINFVYRSRVAHKRMLTVMCDCVLGLVSSVIVPAALFFVYLNDYEPATRSIERTRWYDDKWLVQFWSEHDLVIIPSWVGALSRLFFAVGLLLSMENVKQLLRVETVKPVVAQSGPVSIRRLQLGETRARPTGPWMTTTNVHVTRGVVNQLQRISWSAVFYATLALYGVVIVGLQADAEIKHVSTPRLPVCPIQFSKWVHDAPACLLLEIDCHALRIDGKADQIQKHWRTVDTNHVLRLVIRHCPAFEMPLSIGIFNNLKSIKLYNSTLVSWNHSTSFTDTELPKIRSLQFIRVNFTSAQLPQGLRSADFPQQVRAMDFCVTNLRDLTPELDQIWPKGLRLSLESSHFTAIPPVVLRLSPWQLSVSGNAIHDVPAELFQSLDIRRIGLAHTLISSLPSNISEASPMLRQVSIAYTPVAESPPQWMDAVVVRAETLPYLVVALFAGGTPLCVDDPSTKAMIRSQSISCDASLDEISYPLAFEDQQSGL